MQSAHYLPKQLQLTYVLGSMASVQNRRGLTMPLPVTEASFFENSIVLMDGEVQGWNDLPIGVGKMIVSELSIWFTKEVHFDNDGHGFWMFIRFFGFLNRLESGSRSGEGRSSFTAKQIENIRIQIGKFFYGDQSSRIFPFTRSDCRFLGVNYDDHCFKVISTAFYEI